jgi:HrpA-like RNA helicase
VGGTGSGRPHRSHSTLHEAGVGKIIWLDRLQSPGGVAAMSVAAVWLRMNVKLGQEVGYSIRFGTASDSIDEG